jgi:hypothetical protein
MDIRIDHIVGCIITAAKDGESKGISALANCVRYSDSYDNVSAEERQKLADTLDKLAGQ